MKPTFMENPLYNGNATPDQLRAYAIYRQENDITRLKWLLDGTKERDLQVENGYMWAKCQDEYREPLAIDATKILDVQLSTGDAADGYKLTFDATDRLLSGVYYWADWGVYEEVALSDEALKVVDRAFNPSFRYK